MRLFDVYKRRFPEAADRIATMRWIWRDLLNDRGRQKSMVLFWIIMASAAASVAQPYGIGLLFKALDEKEFTILASGIGVMASFALLEQGLTWCRQYVREQVFNVNFWHIPSMLTREYFSRTLGTLIAEDAEIDGGGVESTRDKIWTIQDHMLFSMLPAYSLVLFALLACAWAAPVFGLLALGYVALDAVFSYRQNNYMHRVMEPIARGLRAWDRRVRNRWADASTVKYNGVEERVETELATEVQPTLRADFEVWAKWFPRTLFTQKVLGALCRLGIYVYAGMEALSGRVNIEGMTLLVFSLERITHELQEISNSQRVIQEMLIRVRAYREALTVKPLFHYAEGESFRNSEKGVSIELRNVSLSHRMKCRDVPVLRDVSLAIERGDRVAVIGPSGAGKSQLTNLILRASDPTEGVVLINGRDLREFALASFCARVGHVPQAAEVFEGSIRENVCFGLDSLAKSRITDCDVEKAIRKAGLDFAGRLHDGLDTLIGYRGMRLSGGERQRLTIARAHIKRPDLVIADEATSALDSLSEAHVLDELYGSLESGTTAIMIAHRLSSLSRCTKIIFVRPLHLCEDDGVQVTVHSSMQELYESDELFRQMADGQSFKP